MSITSRQLSALYRKSHNQMRDVDGLQPQEAFDELLKYLFVKESADEAHHQFPPLSPTIFHDEISSLNKRLVEEFRYQLEVFLKKTNSCTSELWHDKAFHLSDRALLGVHELFERINFSTIDIDTRSAALNEFIPGELRKGLGIFPTPDAVARMMVEVVSPTVSSRVFDPACGTGTFLGETIRRLSSNHSNKNNFPVWGVDKSARMLLLSELNLGHNKKIEYRRALADSLYQPPSTLFDEVNEGFDYILTNPPFGVIVDRNKHDMTRFLTCRGQDNGIVKRQQSEVVFIEQCMKYLKPGGMLGIVLPRSVVTNSSLRFARQALNTLGYLEAIVTLPPETFYISGTQTNTVVLFLRRYKSSSEKEESVAVVSADVDNVGFDSTGRPREGNQLESVSRTLRTAMKGRGVYIPVRIPVRILPKIAKEVSIARLPSLLAGRLEVSNGGGDLPLRELVEIASNGRTPGRSNYSSEGLFLVKVGNLTGHGINWQARARNFVAGIEEVKRRNNIRLMLRKGDILLTSSAHSPVYIAKKVDIVGTVPKWVGGEASFVGEIMMLRVKKQLDPVVLLAYLRLPSTQQQILTLVRGQTAHLHPKDLLEMQIPRWLIRPTPVICKLADQIKKESRLAEEMNELAFVQREIAVKVENTLTR